MDLSANSTDQFDQLRKIVEYAIQREEETHQFYTDLVSRVKAQSVADELRRIAAMELDHKARLQKMDIDGVATSSVKQVLDLKIADYVVEAQPTPEMYWQDLLNIAMHKELASMRLYQDLAGVIADPKAKSLFEHLASEEATHKLFFERVWDDEVLTEN